MKLLLTSAFLLFILGCGTVHQADNKVSRASYVGDSSSYKFTPITVTVKDKKGKMLNFNLTFAAIINSVKNSHEEPSKSSSYTSSYDAVGIVRRLQTRIKSQIIQEILYLKPAAITDQQVLHAVLQKKAQAIFDKEYDKWSKSSYYNVKIVITSLYFTDMSVGGEASPKRW